MSIRQSYRLRLQRQRWKLRAFRKSRELRIVSDNTRKINADDTLLFCTFRNEDIRLPYFLKYYREMGINHFLFVDNDSTDGGREYLARQEDTSVWTTKVSYRKARFGVDWLNYLLRKYGKNHWCLTVDPDEFFIYPFCDTRPISALTDWLDASNVRNFGAMLLDMYPKGTFDGTPYQRGQNPLEIAQWFDSGNYTIHKNQRYWNLWIQGGPRSRVLFANAPEKAPALNKIPLVKWERKYAYISSTHTLLPRGLNIVYDEWGGEKASGVLLHTKFLDTFSEKAIEEVKRGEHYAESYEYKAYADAIGQQKEFWSPHSEKYINWRQLEVLGLISKGNWA